MGVSILRRIQAGLQKCTLLVILFFFFCLLNRCYPSRLLILQAYTNVEAAAHDHHIYQKPQGHTSSASKFPNECLSSTLQAMQQEKRVLIHGTDQEKADGEGDYMEEEMKKVRTLRKRIGSRPPMCRDKCETCFPCEAVKMVPTPSTISSSSMQNMVHLDYSNYDPEGWKCKCGARIFNP